MKDNLEVDVDETENYEEQHPIVSAIKTAIPCIVTLVLLIAWLVFLVNG